jgi:two-component system, NarL family, nitrate/nitrite response regulator NarL
MTRVYLVSRTRLYRDGLSDALARCFEVVGKAGDAIDAIAEIACSRADVVLLDGDAPNSVDAVRAVVLAAPRAKVIALAMPEVEPRLIALAEAGISGYVSREGTIADLVDAVNSVSRGEMRCSPRMAATLLHRVTTLAAQHPAHPRAHLTRRQLEIMALIDEGLTNKQIATRLCIELPTVKNHLHQIYARLDVTRRTEAAARAREQGLALRAAAGRASGS